MSSWVHPTAIVEPDVELGDGVEVGPFCQFQGRVVIGEGCRFQNGVALGGPPMDRAYRGELTEVRVGRRNVFFEFSTVHRSVGDGTATVIGDDNWVMAYVHIAHNCWIGNGCTLTNGVQLGGYTRVGDRANLGGLTGVHQNSCIGRLAMIGACSYVNKDIPPFLLAAGRPCRVYGLNRVGLLRAGFAQSKIAALEHAFRLVYRSTLNLSQALQRIERDLIPGPADAELREFIEFCGTSRRGIELRSRLAVSDSFGQK